MTSDISLNRIKQLDSLLAVLDSPNEGDEVSFTLLGSNIKYRGIIKKKKPANGAAIYEISSKTFPTPKGVVSTIEYKGKIFNVTGGWKEV